MSGIRTKRPRLPSCKIAAATILLLLVVAPARAHSLKDVENNLYAREQYFQPVDLQAPPFSLQNAVGKAVSLADYRGKVVVLNFIYASCGDVCPMHSVLIAQLQKMINETSMRDRVAFISITTDPVHDTGPVLTEYGAARGLDPVNWTFLTSSASQPEDATRAIAKSYGLEFTRTDDGDQMHGIVTNVIDRDGRLRGRFHGLNFEPVNFVTFVNALVNDYHKPGEEDDQPTGFWSWFASLFGLQGDQQQ